MLHKQRNRKLPGQNKSSNHTAWIQEFEINVRTKIAPISQLINRLIGVICIPIFSSIFHFHFMYFQTLSYLLICSGIPSLSASS